jgi:hypothetical protein
MYLSRVIVNDAPAAILRSLPTLQYVQQPARICESYLHVLVF